MPAYPSSEATLRELLAATLDVAGNLSSEGALVQGLEELQDLLIDINANINDGVPMTPADLDALESITATIIGLPSDYPDAGANTKLASILSELQGVLDVAVSNWPADYPDALTQSRLLTVSNTLLDILGEIGDNGTLLDAIKDAVEGTLVVSGSVSVSNFPAVQPVSDNGGSLTVDGTVAVSNPGLTDTQLRATAVPVTDTRTDYPSTGANTKLDTLHTDVASTNTKLDTVHSDLGSVPGFITPPIGSGVIAWLYGIYDKVSNLVTLNDDRTFISGSSNITARDIASTETVSATGDTVVTGTPTANSYQSYALLRDQGARLVVTGTFTGTLVVETSLDGTTWFRSVLYQEDGTRISSFTAPITGMVQTSGAQYVRVRSTTAWTGTANIGLVGSVGLAVTNGVDKAQLGSATTSPPSSGVGIIGWLRGIYDKVAALPTTIGLTDTQLRATPVPISGTVTASGPLTDTQLRATPVPVSGTVTVTDGSGPISVDDNGGSLTVDGTVTTSPPANASTNMAQVGGTATDTNSGSKSAGTQRVVLATDQPQLATALKVDGSAVTQPVSVSGTIPTDAQLATPQIVSGSGAVANAVFIASTEAKGSHLSLYFTGTSSVDKVGIEQSNDGTNWVSVSLSRTDVRVPYSADLATSFSRSQMYGGPVSARYIRAYAGASNTGTVTATIVISANPRPPQERAVAPFDAMTNTQATVTAFESAFGMVYDETADAWSRLRSLKSIVDHSTDPTGLLASGILGWSGTNYKRVLTDSSGVLAIQDNGGAISIDDNGSTISIDDGAGSITVDGTVITTPPSNASTNITQLAGTAVDVNSGTKSAGTQRVVLATDQPQLTTPLNIEGRYSYNNLLALATTTVKSGAGVLHGIVINKKGVSANTLTIWDNTAASGTKIATIDTVNAPIGILLFDTVFATGLTVVLATGTAADITVLYR